MQIQQTHRDYDQTRSTRSPWTKKKRKGEEHFLNASCLLACLPPLRSPPEEERGRNPNPAMHSPGSFAGHIGEDDKSAVEWHSFRTPDDHSKLDVQDSGVQTRKKVLFPEIFQLGHTDCPGTPVRYDRAECVILTFLLTYYRLRRFGPMWISTYAQAFFPVFFSSGEISPKSEIAK